MEVEAFQILDPESFYRKFVSNGARPDGRGLHDTRETLVQTGVLSADHVASSAMVVIGGTKVVAGVSLLVKSPALASPTWGDLEASLHLTPLCSTAFSTGPRQPLEAQVIEHQVCEAILGSSAFDRSQLCIKESMAVWKVVVDIICLGYDGNVADAAMIATVACLKSLSLPETIINDKNEVLLVGGSNRSNSSNSSSRKGSGTPLRLNHLPLPFTCGLFGTSIVADPTLQEEGLLDSVVTVVQAEDGQICGVYKPGGAVLLGRQLQQVLALGRSRVKALLAAL
ncbi:unnamed protein product [Chrysoparadoxa australica]